LVESKHFPY